MKVVLNSEPTWCLFNPKRSGCNDEHVFRSVFFDYDGSTCPMWKAFDKVSQENILWRGASTVNATLLGRLDIQQLHICGDPGELVCGMFHSGACRARSASRHIWGRECSSVVSWSA